MCLFPSLAEQEGSGVVQPRAQEGEGRGLGPDSALLSRKLRDWEGGETGPRRQLVKKKRGGNKEEREEKHDMVQRYVCLFPLSFPFFFLFSAVKEGGKGCVCQDTGLGNKHKKKGGRGGGKNGAGLMFLFVGRVGQELKRKKKGRGREGQLCQPLAQCSAGLAEGGEGPKGWERGGEEEEETERRGERGGVPHTPQEPTAGSSSSSCCACFKTAAAAEGGGRCQRGPAGGRPATGEVRSGV